MAEKWIMNAEQASAIDDFVQLYDDVWFDLGEHLTCTETNVFADLLRAFGKYSAAEVLLDAHSRSDDEGDLHFVGEAS